MKNLFLTAVCSTAVLLLISGVAPKAASGSLDAAPTQSVFPSAALSATPTPVPTPTVVPTPTPAPCVREMNFISEDPPEDVLIPKYYNSLFEGDVHIYAFTDASGKVARRVYGSLETVWSDGETEVVSGFFEVDEDCKIISNTPVELEDETYGEAVALGESITVKGYKRAANGVYYFKSAGGIKHYRVYASVGGVDGIYPCDKEGNVERGALAADLEQDKLLMSYQVISLFVGDAPHVMLTAPTKTTLINMNNRLDASYVPQGMVAVSKHVHRAPFTLRNNGTYANAEALECFLEMVNAAYAEKGFDTFYLCSVYRSYSTQKELWDYRVSNNPSYGTNPLVPIGSAYPGTSEHQSGFAFDIGTLKHKVLGSYLANTAEHKWLAENSWRFGFILRYQKEKEYITGIKYEPYHFRYVGKELAEYLYKENMCLEEYYDAPVVWVDETATEPKEEQR